MEQLARQEAKAEPQQQRGLQFSDRDEHIYFWFPLLAGLSELTFDPRQDIRSSALGVRLRCLVVLSHITWLTELQALHPQQQAVSARECISAACLKSGHQSRAGAGAV